MAFDRLLGEKQRLRDLAVAATLGREAGDTALRGRERGDARERAAARSRAGVDDAVRRARLGQRGGAESLGDLERPLEGSRPPRAVSARACSSLASERARASTAASSVSRSALISPIVRSAIPSSRRAPKGRARSTCSSQASSASEVRPLACSAVARRLAAGDEAGIPQAPRALPALRLAGVASASWTRPCARRRRASVSSMNVNPNSSGRSSSRPVSAGQCPASSSCPRSSQRVDERRDHRRQRGPVRAQR